MSSLNKKKDLSSLSVLPLSRHEAIRAVSETKDASRSRESEGKSVLTSRLDGDAIIAVVADERTRGGARRPPLLDCVAAGGHAEFVPVARAAADRVPLDSSI